MPARRPCHDAPCACAQSSIRTIPSDAAVRGDLLDVERDVAADVDEEDGMRPVLVHLALEVVERHAQVVPVAVDELDAAAGGLRSPAASP